jgi:hypothetical protein
MALVIIRNQANKAGQGKLERMLREVKAMVEEEAQKRLAEKSALSASGDKDE